MHPVSPVGAIDDLIEGTVAGAAGKKSAKTPAPKNTEMGRSESATAERIRQREAANAEVDERLMVQLKKGVEALLDKKAEKLVVLKLLGLTTISDYFVLATATNDRQAQALADAVQDALRKEGRRPLSVEGYQSAAWILVDYGDVVFHVFHDESRRFYGLERLWGDAPDATSEFAG
ncbi:MAG: ribosome silencing factor [Thermoanaerobaculia bacterium]